MLKHNNKSPRNNKYNLNGKGLNMPVHGDHGAASESVNYRQKYKTLKKKLKLLVYEQECFLEELRKSQRKLLRVSRDRSFLLDRLMQYEKVEESSGDSDATASSDSEAEKSKEVPKKKKTSQGLLSLYSNTGLLGSLASSNLASLSTTTAAVANPGSSGGTVGEPPKKKQKVTKKVVKTPASTNAGSTSQLKQSPTTQTKSQSRSLSREEVERQLELRQSKRPQFMSLEKTPHSLPDDIFSNENSNPDVTSSGNGQSSQNVKDGQNLVIDLQEGAV